MQDWSNYTPASLEDGEPNIEQIDCRRIRHLAQVALDSRLAAKA
ncbi:MAG TPA: hypothetical protein VHZ24_17170 [Pirellulales bacterium]|jgi:hypothetical protein|nr:hypothetical protein [Pirellulales bacterium]